MKKYRFISEEDLTAVAHFIDLVSKEFPVDKIGELGSFKRAAIEALGRTHDAQDRGLFLSMLRTIQQDIGSICNAIEGLEGRAQLADKLVPPVQLRGKTIVGPPVQQMREEDERAYRATPLIPGEEAVMLEFDDFPGGEL